MTERHTPDTIGLPGYPSPTARGGTITPPPAPVDPEERRHREVIAQLEHVVDKLQLIINRLGPPR